MANGERRLKKKMADDLGIRISIDLNSDSVENIENLFFGIMNFVNDKGYAVYSGAINCEKFMEYPHGFDADKLKKIYDSWRKEVETEDEG